jgi:hypothetical protein
MARRAALASLSAYEQLPLAVLVSLQAVEAALRGRLQQAGYPTTGRNGAPLGWDALWAKAQAAGLISADLDQHGKDLLDYGRRLRNMYSHPDAAYVMTYAAALPLIETSHRMVNRISQDDQSAGQ